MHLLVLSAFRQAAGERVNDLWLSSQCTFWCSVLSDLTNAGVEVAMQMVSMHLLVLSAFRRDMPEIKTDGFFEVSMHLLVLSAFRPE